MLKFELSEQTTQTIAAILGEHSYKIVAPILAEMQKQIDAQKTPVDAAPPAAAV